MEVSTWYLDKEDLKTHCAYADMGAGAIESHVGFQIIISGSSVCLLFYFHNNQHLKNFRMQFHRLCYFPSPNPSLTLIPPVLL